MVSETFKNLPLPRQEAFLRAALEEFAHHSYNDASVSRILRKLAIAKGSFYHYFGNKKGLYLYLKDKAEAQKQAYIERTLAEGYQDFWDLYRKLYTAGSQFDLDHPLLSAFLYNLSQEKALPDLATSWPEQLDQGIRFFRRILSEEQAQGRLNPDLNPDTMAYIIMQVGRGITDWLAWKQQINFRDNIQETGPVLGSHQEALHRSVEEIAHILKSGMNHDSR